MDRFKGYAEKQREKERDKEKESEGGRESERESEPERIQRGMAISYFWRDGGRQHYLLSKWVPTF